ncbi:MAG: sulfite exporter TauE/SafE family protein [Deltaproteobacteria bacterium]|nr:sulfite exporter TauE/SafE family protein [Deltaproteobacteria bacterium]
MSKGHSLMALILFLASFVGIFLGLLGGGGSILTVPLLVYVADVDEKSAIAMSLMIVGITAAFAAIGHARKGNVRWKIGLIFSVGGMTGAFFGGKLGAMLDPMLLMVLFALMMLVTGIAMWRPKKEVNGKGELSIGLALLEGFGVGIVTGLVGAGGGFLVVPALAILGGLEMREAVGTSLLVIALKSGAGFLGYASSDAVHVDYTLAAYVTVAAVLGSFVGARFASNIDQKKLRKGFSVFVLVMGVVVLAKQFL